MHSFSFLLLSSCAFLYSPVTIRQVKKTQLVENADCEMWFFMDFFYLLSLCSFIEKCFLYNYCWNAAYLLFICCNHTAKGKAITNARN